MSKSTKPKLSIENMYYLINIVYMTMLFLDYVVKLYSL